MDAETLYDEIGIDRRWPKSPELPKVARSIGDRTLRLVDPEPDEESDDTPHLTTEEERLAYAAEHLAAMRKHLSSLK